MLTHTQGGAKVELLMPPTAPGVSSTGYRGAVMSLRINSTGPTMHHVANSLLGQVNWSPSVLAVNRLTVRPGMTIKHELV